MEHLNKVVYTNESILRHPSLMVKGMCTDLLAGRELAMLLAIRDIRAQYRQAFLGLIWVFLLPLANTAAWLFMQQTGIIKIQSTALPYTVYVFTGTILWAIFMDSVNAPLQQTTAAKPMLAKINFPREALIISGIYQTIFNAIIKIGVLSAALFFLGVVPHSQVIFLPIAILSLILAGTALGLVITPIGILYTDVGKGLPLLMQFFMYITPVVLPIPKTGFAAELFNLNPITPLILTARDLLTGYTPSNIGAFMTVNFAMIILLCAMWVVYRAAMPILIERMSA